ncbi:MAG TPA: hypothetical protein DHU26_02230 [Spirochaetaceae bacterium]|nr:hypothetical protein [Spirochaetaceae bacterium]
MFQTPQNNKRALKNRDFIFYLGELVDSEAYALHMKKLGDEGVALLANYSAQSTDLLALPMRVVFIYGLKGCKHAQFSDYGPQKGDGTAMISREAQREETVTILIELAIKILE